MLSPTANRREKPTDAEAQRSVRGGPWCSYGFLRNGRSAVLRRNVRPHSRDVVHDDVGSVYDARLPQDVVKPAGMAGAGVELWVRPSNSPTSRLHPQICFCAAAERVPEPHSHSDGTNLYGGQRIC